MDVGLLDIEQEGAFDIPLTAVQRSSGHGPAAW